MTSCAVLGASSYTSWLRRTESSSCPPTCTPTVPPSGTITRAGATRLTAGLWEVFAGRDPCATPPTRPTSAPAHPENVGRPAPPMRIGHTESPAYGSERRTCAPRVAVAVWSPHAPPKTSMSQRCGGEAVTPTRTPAATDGRTPKPSANPAEGSTRHFEGGAPAEARISASWLSIGAEAWGFRTTVAPGAGAVAGAGGAGGATGCGADTGSGAGGATGCGVGIGSGAGGTGGVAVRRSAASGSIMSATARA